MGSGGREHALAWKLAAAAGVQSVWTAPGNAGTAEVGRNLTQVAADDGARAPRRGAEQRHRPGGDRPPTTRWRPASADSLRAAGLAVVGPCAAEARLESSKAFCKSFLLRHEIPTAQAKELHDQAELRTPPALPAAVRLVLKMDGLAQGKGVLVSDDGAALLRFGRAALARGTVLAEEYLSGYELSLFLLLDGTRAVALPLCSDFKRAGTGDTGPNNRRHGGDMSRAMG